MQGIQCDNCRKFSEHTAEWLILSHMGGLTGIFGQPINELNGTFCTMRCLAEWSYAKAVIESEATVPEPAPRPRKRKSGGMEDRPRPSA